MHPHTSVERTTRETITSEDDMATRFVGSTVTRMRVKGNLDHPDFTGWLQEALTQNAFTDFPSPASGGTRDGFARADAPLETPDFSDVSAFYLTPYVSFAYREDVKKVPAARLKAAVNAAARAWCAEHMRERCPKQVKLEIKDSIEAEMLPRVTPSSRVVLCVLNVSEGYLVVSTQSEPRIESIRKLVFRSMGIEARVESPDDGLTVEVLEALSNTSPMVLAKSVTIDNREDA